MKRKSVARSQQRKQSVSLSVSPVNSISNLFHKQKLRNRKIEVSKRSVQSLVVKPRHASTPCNNKIKEICIDSDTDCEELVENITPIRCSRQNLSEEVVLHASCNVTNNLNGNVPSESHSNALSREMLALDETFLKGFDLEEAINNYSSSGKEGTTFLDFRGEVLRNNIDAGETEKSSNSVLFIDMDSNASSDILGNAVEEKEEEEEEACADLYSRPKSSSQIFEGTFKLPSVSAIKSKACKGSNEENSNCISAAADFDFDLLNNVDWANDSLMERELNSVCSNNVNRAPENVKPSSDQNAENGLRSVKRLKTRGIMHLTRSVDYLNKNSTSRSVETDVLRKIIPNDRKEVPSENTLPQESHFEQNQLNKSAAKQVVDQASHQTNTKGMKSNLRVSFEERTRNMLSGDAEKSVTIEQKHSNMFLISKTSDGSVINRGTFFGLPSEVENLIKKYKGVERLYDWQTECLNLNAIREKRNLIYALPTSGGKTLVAEILILKELLCFEKNAIFVLPYISIVQEKVHSLSPFAFDLNFLVEEYAAGKGQYPPRKRRHKHSVYIATIEKAHGLVNSLVETKRLSELGLVIVDELHLLGESERGATLECLLTKLTFLAPEVQIVGMSATIGNILEIAKFLKAEVYEKNFRPVELKEYVKCGDTLWAVNNKDELFTEVRKITPPYTPAMCSRDPDRIGGLILEVIPEYSCLVFCFSRKNCENVATMLIKIVPGELMNVKKREREALLVALKFEGRGYICPILKECIPFGIAYHHSGLTSDERKLLEEAYRAGTLCCICCTSTLAAGVNLPAKRVIMRSPFVGCEFISLSQYKQMAGRAGRAGFDKSGESILLCQQRDMARVQALLQSKMNTVDSYLHKTVSRGLQSLVLSAVGLGIASSRYELHKFAACTLLHVQSEKLEVNTNKLVDESIKDLIKLKILKVERSEASSSKQNTCSTSHCDNGNQSTLSVNITLEGQQSKSNLSQAKQNISKKSLKVSFQTRLKISRLGNAAMKGPIDLSKARELYRDLYHHLGKLSFVTYLHLLYLVTPYDMMELIKPRSDKYFDFYNNLDANEMATAQIFGITPACMNKIFKGQQSPNVSERVMQRFYITLILNDLWNQKSVWEVATKYSVPRGTIQTLMNSAASFASCVLHFCEEIAEFWVYKLVLDDFVKRLSHCCSVDLLQLMELPAVKVGRARQLYNAGFKTLKDIAVADVNRLVQSVEHLPRRVATQIIAAAKVLLIAKAENLREDYEDALEVAYASVSQK